MFLKDPRNKQLEVTKFILEWLLFLLMIETLCYRCKKKQQLQNE